MTSPEPSPYPRLVEAASYEPGDLTPDTIRTSPDLVAALSRAWPVIRFGVLLTFFVAAVGCALLMSAVATMDYAVAHGVPHGIRWAPVGLLETLQLAGTFWWLQSRKFWDVAQAMTTVIGTVAVTGTVSAMRFGPLGILAPVVVVGTVHAIYRIIRNRQQPKHATAAAGAALPGRTVAGPLAITPGSVPDPSSGVPDTQPVDTDLASRHAVLCRAIEKGRASREDLKTILQVNEYAAKKLAKGPEDTR